MSTPKYINQRLYDRVKKTSEHRADKVRSLTSKVEKLTDSLESAKRVIQMQADRLNELHR